MRCYDSCLGYCCKLLNQVFGSLASLLKYFSTTASIILPFLALAQLRTLSRTVLAADDKVPHTAVNVQVKATSSAPIISKV